MVVAMTANSRFNPIDALRSLPLGKSQKSAELDLPAPTPAQPPSQGSAEVTEEGGNQ